MQFLVFVCLKDQRKSRYLVPPSPMHTPGDSNFDIYCGLDENSQSASNCSSFFQPSSNKEPDKKKNESGV